MPANAPRVATLRPNGDVLATAPRPSKQLDAALRAACMRKVTARAAFVGPISAGLLELLEDFGYQVDPQVLRLARANGVAVESPHPPYPTELPRLSSDHAMWTERLRPYPGLYPYQQAGVRHLTMNPRTILADDMGVGKTVQAIVGLAVGRGRFPALVVCPASLKLQWRDELARWAPWMSVEILEGRRGPLATDADVTVCNYAILAHRVCPAGHFKSLIADEAHMLKGWSAARSKAFRDLSRGGPEVSTWLLTGTPAYDRPADLAHLLHLTGHLRAMLPDFNGSRVKRAFEARYCEGRELRFGERRPFWDASGAANLRDLRRRMWRSGAMLRRTKAQVLRDLPPLRRTMVHLELKGKHLTAYREAERRRDETLRITRCADGDVLAAEGTTFVELRREVGWAKLEMATAWLKTFFEGTGQSVVVFAYHRDVTMGLAQAFDLPVVIGGQTGERRNAEVRRFMDGGTRAIVCQIQAGGVGLNLQRADHVVFVEQSFLPMEHMQAEARAHRVGGGGVVCWYLVADGTVEDGIFRRMQEKYAAVGASVDGLSTFMFAEGGR